MANTRRYLSSDLKAKIAMELIRGTDTVSQICSRFGIHPTQASKWKHQAIKGMGTIFSDKRSDELKKKGTEKKGTVLFRKRGRFSFNQGFSHFTKITPQGTTFSVAMNEVEPPSFASPQGRTFSHDFSQVFKARCKNT